MRHLGLLCCLSAGVLATSRVSAAPEYPYEAKRAHLSGTAIYEVHLKPDRTAALFLLGFTVLSRLALFAWLDATAFDSTQDRFLFPVLPLWTAFLVLMIGAGLEALRLHRAGVTSSVLASVPGTGENL